MIITLKGADFSAKNIGTLSTWTIFTSLGSGATYSGNKVVDRNGNLSATITIADGYELGSAGVSVIMGTTDVTSSAATVNGNTITISIAAVTGNVTIKVPTLNTSTGEEETPTPSGPSDKLAGTWVFNNDTLTEEELNAFGGYPATDYGLSYSAYTAYKVNISMSVGGSETSSEYLVKSNNNVVLGYDRNGSAIYFALNGSLSSLDNLSLTINSKLSEVTGGQMLLDWLNSVATNTTNPDSGTEQPEEGGEGTVGEDELAGTWTMNENITATPATFGGKNGNTGLGLSWANLYQGYKLNYTAGTTDLEYIFVHTSVENMLGKANETSTGVSALYINDAWSPVGARYITIHSKLSEVEGGDTLLAWFKANGTKTS